MSTGELTRRRIALLSTSALARCSLAVLLASSAGLASAATLDGAGQSGFDTNIPIATQTGRNDTVNITIGNTSGTVTLGTDLVLPGSATGIQLNFVADTGTPRETARFIVNNDATLEIGEGATVNFANNGWFNVGFGAGQTGSVLLSGGTVNISNAGNVSYLDIGNGGTGTFTQTSGSVELLSSALQLGVNGGVGVYNLEGGSVTLNGGSTLYLGSGTVATAGDGTLNISGSATFTTDAQIFIGGNRGGTGTITQDGEDSVVSLNTVTSRTIFIGSSSGTGTYALSAGTLEMGASGVSFAQGAGATGIFTQSGGSFTSAGLVGMGNGGTATYEISGGTATLNGGLRLAQGGTGSVIQSDDPDIEGAPAVTIGGTGIAFGGGGGVGTYELSGGTLTLAGITGGNASSHIILGGGTLIASQAFVTSAGFVTSLSAETSSTIDTNSFDVGWASAISGDGDLTKSGLGILTLSATNTFTGNVAIDAGTLALSNYAALQGNNVAIADGATLSLQPLAAGTLPTTVLTGEVTGAGTIDLGEAWFTTNVGAGRTVAFSGTILSDAQGYEPRYARFTKDGAGTLNISGSNMQKGEAYVIGGSLLQSSGVTSWDVLAVGSGAGGTGTLNVTGGDIDFGVGLRVGDWGGTGSLVQTGGTVTVEPDCGSIANCASLNVGNQGGTGTYTISGGTLTLAGGRHAIGRNANTVSGGAGTLQINGGIVDLAAGDGVLIIGDPDLNTSGVEAHGTLNQTAGTLRVGAGFRLYLGGWGVSEYNFTGGTMEVGGASLNGNYSGPADYTFNFGNGLIDVTGSALTTDVRAVLTAGTTATIDTNALGATWNGILSGTGTLAKLGASTLTLGGVNSFTGDIALNEGTLALSNAGALNGNNVAMAAGTTLSLVPLGPTANVLAGEISGTTTNAINLGDSGLVTTVGAGRTVAYSGGIVSIGQAYDSAYGRFIKAGAGDLNISGATMTGGEGLVIGGRLLQTAGTTNWDTMAVGTGGGNTGNLTVSGGQINFGIGLRVGDFGGTGSVTQTGGTVKVEATCGDDERCAALNIGNQGGTGTYTISNGTLRLVGGSNSIGRNAGNNAGGTGMLQINGGLVSVEAHADPEFGLGALTIGDLTASNVAEATGIINQTGGILRMGAGSVLNLAGYGSGTYNLNGGALEIGGSSLRGALNPEGVYAFNLGGGVIDVTGSALTTSVNATLVASTSSTIDTNLLGATWSGVLSGAGALVKTGASTLTLSGINTFTGDLTVNQGAVSITADANLGDTSSSLILNGGTLTSTDDVSLAAGRGVTLGASGGTFDTEGTITLQFSSAIDGAGGLTKTGIGSLVLSGANTYAGGTTVSQGTLGFGSAATTLVGNILNNDLVIFNFGDADPVRVFSNIISGTGAVGIFGNAEIIFDTAQAYTGNTVIGGNASLQIGNGGTTGSVAGNIYNDAALSFNRSDDIVYGGAITGVETTATFTKLNTNTLTLTGTSSYAGSVTVAAGNLRLNGGALTGGGDVIVQAGAGFGGTGSVAGAVTVQDDATITNGSAGAQLAVGELNLNSTSTVQAYLGDTDNPDELFKVAGALTLDGNLDVMSATNGAGVYKLMTYGGALTNNGLNIRLLPEDFRASLNLTVAGEVRLGLADDDGYQSWTANGSTTTGGSGTWTSDSNTWLDQGGNVISAWGGTVGVFDGTAGTVTVAGVQQFTTLEFVTTGYVLTPQDGAAGLNFTDGGTLWTEGADVTATVETAISGTGGLKKVGAGTLILSGTNTYTGGTRVEAGTLSVSSDANLGGVGGVTLVNGSTLSATSSFASSRAIALETGGILATGSELSLSGVVSGTGGLTKAGAGTVILSAANTYTGGTTITGGILQIGDGGTTGSILGNVATVGISSSLAFDRTDNITFSGNVSGTGNIRQDGAGILTLSGTNTNTGVVSVANGVLATSGGNAIADTALLDVATEVRLGANETVGNIAGSGVFNLGSYTLTTGGAGGQRGMGGSLQGTGSLVKTGSGIVILGGVNTYSGTTTVLSGTLVSTGSALSDTALLTVASGATATFQQGNEIIGSLTGGGTVGLRGVTLILGNDDTSTTFAGIFADNTTAGGFTKTGTGTFTVSGASTNTGTNTVAEGTLLVTGFLGSGALNVESGATLGGSGAIDGTVTIANGGTLTNVSAGTRLSMGALNLNETSTVQAYFGSTPNTELYTVAGDLTLDGNLDILGAGNGAGVYKLMTYGGTLTNDGIDVRAVPTGYRAGINLSTAGEVRVGLADAAGFQYWTANGSTTLGGAGTWTADSQTWVDQDGNVVSNWAGTVGVFDGTAGVVTVSGMQQFQTLEFLTDGYTLTPQTIASGLNFTGGGTLWTEGADVTTTVATRIMGSGGLKKVGAGTLVLTGANSYTGGTRVEAGTLSISSDGNLGGVGGVTLANGATLAATASFASSRAISLETGGIIDTAADVDLALSGVISGNGWLLKSGAGAIIVSGANTYTGGTTITGGTLQVGNGAATGSITGNVTVGTNSVLAFNRSDDIAFGGNISGAGYVLKDGAGTLTLSGNNSYSGDTNVEQGVLVTAGGNAIGDTSAVDITTELRLGANETIGNLFGEGLLDLGSYTLTTGGGGGAYEFDGVLQGSGSLIKTGSGIAILAGANTYTGTTTVQSGTLSVSGGSSLSDTARLTVAAGATTIFETNETIGSLAGGGTVGLQGIELTLGGDNSSSVFSGAFIDDSVAGSFTKTGTGTFEVSGISTNTGANSVAAGTLLVSGTLGTGAVNVASGATLTGGGGTIGGAVTIASGGTLAGGYQGGLTMGALTLSDGATTNVTLDTPNAPDSIFYVNGDLAVDGTLNVAGAPQYGVGVYRVFTTTGTLTDNGLELGQTPRGGFDTSLDINGGANVDLVVSSLAGQPQFWSGDGVDRGGSGTWTSTNDWLYVDGRADYWLGGVAVFSGTAGQITVDGAQSFQTLEFMTDGYVVNAGTNGSLNVTSELGQLWAEGTDVTATINAPITGTGIIGKVGAGTIVLTGANTYSGGTAILQGTLSVSADANLGAASGGIALAGGTLATTASFASARAVVLVAPSESEDISGTNTYTGGLTVSAGTLVLGGAGTLTKIGTGGLILSGSETDADDSASALSMARAAAPSISGGIIDTVGAPTTLTLSGVISGEGDLVKTGLGTLILTGNNTYTGLTTIAEGTLQIGNGGTSGTIIGDIVNDALLVFARSDTYAFPGSISGTGTVNFNGGTVVFASPESFTGPINVNGSMVQLVNGSVSYSPFTINDGGVIGGSGTIGALTVNNGGTVAPGYSPGTLNVIGNVAFNAGSTYAVDVTPSGAHDLITAGGTVTISGGSTVDVLAESGVYAATQTYAIITADGAVTGSFGTISSDFAFLTPSLSYDAQNVYLTLDYNNIDFAAFATTQNQAAVANAAQSLGFDNPVFDAIFSMSADELPAAFNSLSGEIGASAKGVLVNDSQFVRNAVFERLVTAGSAAPSGMSVAPLGYAAPAKPGVPYPTKAEPLAVAAPTSALWAQGFGSWGSTDGNGNAASINRDTGGFFIGADTLVGDWRLGVLGGYSQTSFDVDARSSSGESDNIHAGLYAGTNWGAINFRTGAAYTWNDISTSRSVGIPSPQLLEADYDAGTAQVFGELGYGLTFGAVDFEPFAGLAYVNLHTDGFSETGGPAALVSGSDSTDATYTTLGLRASTVFETGSFTTTLRGMLGWRHAFGDITPTTAYQFAAGGSPFTVSGLPIAEDALVMDVGLDMALTDAASIGVFYSAQFGDSAQDQSVRGTLNWKF